jgi:hypothetical protein
VDPRAKLLQEKTTMAKRLRFVLLVLLTPVEDECSEPCIFHGWHIVSSPPWVSWPILCPTRDGKTSWPREFGHGHKTVKPADVATVSGLCPECLAAYQANPEDYQFTAHQLGRYTTDKLPTRYFLRKVGLRPALILGPSV